MEESINSGDFLSDVDILITLRSGNSDFKVLQKLMNAIVASSTSLVDTEIEIKRSEIKQIVTSGKKLTVISTTLRIE